MIDIDFMIGGKALAKVVFYYGLSDLNDVKIVCPFHKDINPSLQLDYETGKWFCFGCGLSGDALGFVKNIEKTDDLSACLKLVKILRSKKTREIKVRHVAKRYKGDTHQALTEAHDDYFGLKTTNWYDVDDEAEEIKSYMIKRGFSPETLNKAKAKYTYKKAYPIMFPLLDNGDFKGWVCRTNVKSIEQKRKYLYNTGFSRATTLVGDYKSRKTVMVVEGYMDMLKMRQFGVKHVVALLGWKATDNQISKLKDQGVTNIISALDTDECGQKGTQYLRSFFSVVRFQYPEGVKDAGDLTKAQFKKAYNLTIKTWRKQKHEHRKSDQRSGKKVRNKQG